LMIQCKLTVKKKPLFYDRLLELYKKRRLVSLFNTNTYQLLKTLAKIKV